MKDMPVKVTRGRGIGRRWGGALECVCQRQSDGLSFRCVCRGKGDCLALNFFISSFCSLQYTFFNPKHIMLVGSFKSSTRRRRSSTWCWARWTRAGRRRAKSGQWRWPCPCDAGGAAAAGTAARSAAAPSASTPAPPPAARPARPTRSRRRCSCCCTASRPRRWWCRQRRPPRRATTAFDFSIEQRNVDFKYTCIPLSKIWATM